MYRSSWSFDFRSTGSCRVVSGNVRPSGSHDGSHDCLPTHRPEFRSDVGRIYESASKGTIRVVPAAGRPARPGRRSFRRPASGSDLRDRLFDGSDEYVLDPAFDEIDDPPPTKNRNTDPRAPPISLAHAVPAREARPDDALAIAPRTLVHAERTRKIGVPIGRRGPTLRLGQVLDSRFPPYDFCLLACDVRGSKSPDIVVDRADRRLVVCRHFQRAGDRGMRCSGERLGGWDGFVGPQAVQCVSRCACCDIVGWWRQCCAGC